MSAPKLYTERELLERIAYLGPNPHTAGEATVRSYTWSGAVTEAAVWTPQSGNRYVVSNIVVSASAACTVTR